jgi:hypothetical protein
MALTVVVDVDEELLERLQRLTGVGDTTRIVDAALRTLAAHVTLRQLGVEGIRFELRGVLAPDR